MNGITKIDSTCFDLSAASTPRDLMTAIQDHIDRQFLKDGNELPTPTELASWFLRGEPTGSAKDSKLAAGIKGVCLAYDNSPFVRERHGRYFVYLPVTTTSGNGKKK